MDLQTLLADLETLLSVSEFTDYCPNGLQVEGKKKIKKLGFAVSASVSTIEEAVRKGVDALIVHHGIFWNKDPQPLVGVKKKKVELLISSGMSLLAYHLPLDAHRELGNNWKAALDLGWDDLEPFFLQGRQYLGVKAKLAPRSVFTFQKELETYYGRAAHVALGGRKEVRSVALVSGGAHRTIDLAADQGIDCYITGSFDEMIWDIAKEREINFFALGHYSTETVGVRALMHYVQNQTALPCEWIDLFNPF